MEEEIWQARDYLTLDGSMGLSLTDRGVEVLRDIWSAHALMAAPDVVRDLHGEYIRAGADVITTNNYVCVPHYLAKQQLRDRLVDLATLSARLAREVVAHSDLGDSYRSSLVTGALPPLRESYDPGEKFDTAAAAPGYHTIAQTLAVDVDLLIFETMASIAQARSAGEAAAETGKPVWIALTLTDDGSGHLRSGESLADTIAALQDLGVDAFLFNCCVPESIDPGLQILSDLTDRPIGAYANAFRPVLEGWTLEEGGIVYDEGVNPEKYADHVSHWQSPAASIIGGCCGIGPDHIHHLNEVVTRTN